MVGVIKCCSGLLPQALTLPHAEMWPPPVTFKTRTAPLRCSRSWPRDANIQPQARPQRASSLRIQEWRSSCLLSEHGSSMSHFVLVAQWRLAALNEQNWSRTMSNYEVSFNLLAAVPVFDKEPDCDNEQFASTIMLSQARCFPSSCTRTLPCSSPAHGQTCLHQQERHARASTQRCNKTALCETLVPSEISGREAARKTW